MFSLCDPCQHLCGTVLNLLQLIYSILGVDQIGQLYKMLAFEK